MCIAKQYALTALMLPCLAKQRRDLPCRLASQKTVRDEWQQAMATGNDLDTTNLCEHREV